MSINKEQFCSKCQVLILLTSKLCPHCGNELELVRIGSEPSKIPIEPGLILINRYQICEQLITDISDTREFLAQDLQSQDLVIITNHYRNVDDSRIKEMGLMLEDLELFKQQVLSWKGFQHPAIPKYLDAFYFDDLIDTGIFVVRAYLNAPSIGTVIRAGRKFSEAEVIELADRLLSILIYIHGCTKPVIHRNISPETILLVENPDDPIGDVYLTGFGLSPTPNIQDWRDNYKGAICYQSYRRFFFDSVSVHYDSSCLGITLLYTLTGKDVERFCIDYDQVSKKFSNWIGRLGYCSYSEHLSYDEIFKSAESARVALNTEEVPSSSRLTPPSPDPDPTASTPLIDRDTSRSSNKPLYLQLILIGAIVTLGWIVAAKYSVPTLDQQQNQLPRSIGK